MCEGSEWMNVWKMYIWRKRVKRMEAGFYRWCWAVRWEEIGRNRITDSSTWTRGRTLLCGWPSTGTDCPKRLWSLLHCRYSGAIWMHSYANWTSSPCAMGCLCLSKDVGPDDLQWHLSGILTHSTIVWLCEEAGPSPFSHKDLLNLLIHFFMA